MSPIIIQDDLSRASVSDLCEESEDKVVNAAVITRETSIESDILMRVQ